MKNKVLILLLLGNYCFGLSLSEAFNQALINNNEYKSKSFQLKAVDYYEEKIKSQKDSKIDFSLNSGVNRYITNSTTNPTKDYDHYTTYNINMIKPLIAPRTEALIKQTQFIKKEETLKMEEFSQKLAFDIFEAYFQLFLAKESYQFAISNYKFYELKYLRTKELLSQGLSNKIDFLNTKMYLERALIEKNLANKNQSLAILKLKKLTGAEIKEIPNINLSINNLEKLPINNITLDNNIDLKKAINTKDIAKKEINVQKSDYYPQVNLNINLAKNHNNTSTYKVDNRAQIQVVIPLYAGNKNISQIKEAQLRYKATLENEIQLRQDIEYKFEELLQEYDFNKKNLEILELSKTSSMKNLEAITEARKLGLKSEIDLLEAYANKMNVKKEYLEESVKLLLNYVSLLVLSGEFKQESIKNIENSIYSL